MTDIDAELTGQDITANFGAYDTVSGAASLITLDRLVSSVPGSIKQSRIQDGVTAGKVLTLAAADTFTITVPATGTAALLGTANAFTAAQTFSAGATCSALTVSNLTAGRVPFAGTAGLLGDSADILARTGPLAGSTTEYGLYLNLTSTGQRNTVRTLQVDFTQSAVTGASDAGTAIWANAKSGGSSDFNHFVGLQSYADHAGSGTVGGVYGLNVYLFNSGGGSIGNLYGLNITPPTSMTGVTNAYGIYIGDFTAGKYAIYTGTGIARLGGTLSCVGLATFSGGAVFGIDPGGTAALRIGSVPDSTYGNLNVSDTTPFAAGVGGVVGLAGKYNTAGDYANFAEIRGRKADAVDGNYVGILALRAQAGGSPYMHDVVTINGATDLTTLAGGAVIGGTALLASERLRVAGGTMGVPGSTDVLIAAGSIACGSGLSVSGIATIGSQTGTNLNKLMVVGDATTAAGPQHVVVGIPNTAGNRSGVQFYAIDSSNVVTGGVAGFAAQIVSGTAYPSIVGILDFTVQNGGSTITTATVYPTAFAVNVGTASTSTTTGAMIVAGGVGIGGALNVGTDVSAPHVTASVWCKSIGTSVVKKGTTSPGSDIVGVSGAGVFYQYDSANDYAQMFVYDYGAATGKALKINQYGGLVSVGGSAVIGSDALVDSERLRVTGGSAAAAGATDVLAGAGVLDFGDSVRYRGTKVLGAQGAAVADASGGSTVDTEARAAINALLAHVRAHGLIAT